MHKIRVGKRVIFGVPGSLATEPVLSLSNNSAGVLTFKMPPDDFLYTQTNNDWIGNWWWDDRTALVEVLRGELVIWRGFIRRIEIDIDKTKTVTAEGVLSFLNDTFLAPFESDHEMTLQQWFEYLIDKHNSNAETSTFKQLKIGQIASDIVEDEDDLYRKIEGYQKTKDVIDGIVEKHGGYLYVTYGGDDTYINYELQHGGDFDCAQTLRYGHNLIDIKFTYSTESLVNLLVPIGDDGITAEMEGLPAYVADQGSQQLYGVMAQIKQFDGIDDPAKLRKAAWEYINKNNEVRRDIEAVAIDMSAVDINTDIYRVGSLVRIKSFEHRLDEYMRVTSIRLDLEHPEKSEYTLGNPSDDLYHHILKGQRLIESDPVKGSKLKTGRIYPKALHGKGGDAKAVIKVTANDIKKEPQWNEFWFSDKDLPFCPTGMTFTAAAGAPIPKVHKCWLTTDLYMTGIYHKRFATMAEVKEAVAEVKKTLVPPSKALKLDDLAMYAVSRTINGRTVYLVSDYPENQGTANSYHGVPNNLDLVATIWYGGSETGYFLSCTGFYDSANPSSSWINKSGAAGVTISITGNVAGAKDKPVGYALGGKATPYADGSLVLGKYNEKGSNNDIIVVGNGKSSSDLKTTFVVEKSGDVHARDLLLSNKEFKGVSVTGAFSKLNSPLRQGDTVRLSSSSGFTADADGILSIIGRFNSATGRMYLIMQEAGETVAACDTVSTPDSYFNVTAPMIKGKRYTFLASNVRLDQSYWKPTYFRGVE